MVKSKAGSAVAGAVVAAAVATVANQAAEAVTDAVSGDDAPETGDDTQPEGDKPGLIESVIDAIIPDQVQEAAADTLALAGLAVETFTGIPDGTPANKVRFLLEKLGEALEIVLTDSDADTHAVMKRFGQLQAAFEQHPKAVA
ncbi:hypothetical protein [Asticcacaulis excentricus]|uniref:Secreted protein n=1 Tax=Asticcacaulis excentricus TaxID=78587 RepID=A0A3G9FY12_9CAUL|nr:hypothetical protein [Asticcacaulis excentricus]BBF79930.1 hypothetical protein EM6_0507 [Asticcacaulis excentricus]